MEIKIHTSKGDVPAFHPNGRARAIPVDTYGLVIARCYWQPIPACRLERLVGDVWRVVCGRADCVENCLVTCAANGRAVYRDRSLDRVFLHCPEVENELLGRMVPDPRSSQGGVRG